MSFSINILFLVQFPFFHNLSLKKLPSNALSNASPFQISPLEPTTTTRKSVLVKVQVFFIHAYYTQLLVIPQNLQTGHLRQWLDERGYRTKQKNYSLNYTTIDVDRCVLKDNTSSLSHKPSPYRPRNRCLIFFVLTKKLFFVILRGKYM